MTLSDLEGHLPLVSFSNAIFVQLYVAADKILTDFERRAVPLR